MKCRECDRDTCPTLTVQKPPRFQDAQDVRQFNDAHYRYEKLTREAKRDCRKHHVDWRARAEQYRAMVYESWVEAWDTAHSPKGHAGRLESWRKSAIKAQQDRVELKRTSD